MRTYPESPDERKAAAELAAFLRRDFARHPEHMALAQRFVALSPAERLRRFQEAMNRPMGATFANVLHDEPQLVERLAERTRPNAPTPAVRQASRVAAFEVTTGLAHPRATAERAGVFLARLLGRIGRRTSKLGRVERRRGARGLVYEADLPDGTRLPEAAVPGPALPENLSQVCAVARLNRVQTRLVLAEAQLLREDDGQGEEPGTKQLPPLDALARRCGISTNYAKKLRSQAHAKLKAARPELKAAGLI